MFDWDRFKKGGIVVHCNTEEKAKDFLEECDKQGIKWSHGDKSTLRTNYEVYNNATCYNAGKGVLTYGDISYFESKGIETIKWEIKEMKELTFREVIADIKEGEAWSDGFLKIEKIKDSIAIGSLNGKVFENIVGFVIKPCSRFKLLRKEYTFQEAFKAFEEGKKIESCERVTYKKCSEDSYLMNGTKYNFEEIMLSINEIKNKWYINE